MSALESMTGSALVEKRLAGMMLRISLRSVNHRFLEVSFRLPPHLEQHQADLERLLTASVGRGQVDVLVAFGDGPDQPRIDAAQLKQYVAAASALLGKGVPQRPTDWPSLAALLGLPGVITRGARLPADFSREAVARLFERAVAKLRQAREREGRAIGRLLKQRTRQIRRLLRPLPARVRAIRSRQIDRLRQELLSTLAPDRAAEDAWLDKLKAGWARINVDEELERLKLHLAAVEEQLTKGGAVGRKIEFFAQELLREANTLAAKTPDFEVRAAAVEIKNEIESIREQVRNLC